MKLWIDNERTIVYNKSMRSGKHKATEGEGKHMKYSVYDIIYRNDSNIRRLLENDLLFAETGFVAFRDADGRFWYLYKKEGLLVPGQQDQINRTYGSRDPLSGNRKIRIGEAECDCALPTEECAKDFFTGLSRIGACADWNIESQLWKIASASSALYDAPIRMVRPEQFLDRISTLRCAYVKERETNRRNFTSFEGWEYIDTFELDAQGRVVMPQEFQVQENEAAVGEAASRKTGLDAAPAQEPAKGEGSQAEPGQAGNPVQEPAKGEGSQVEPGQAGKPVQEPAKGEGSQAEPGQAGNSAQEPAGEEGSLKETGQPDSPAQSEKSESVQRAGQAEKEVAESVGEEAPQAGAGQAEKPLQESAKPEAPQAEAGHSETEQAENLTQEAVTGEASPEETGQTGTAGQESAQGEAPSEEAAQAEKTLQEPAKGGTPSRDVPPWRRKTITDVRELLDCDRKRCRLESYEENMLYDIKRGHWDVYGCEEVMETPEKGRLVPRDPRKDIRAGIVGIDFGTKSTVVVRQDDTSAIIPIRIGAGDLSAELRENDYENPTIIECTDLDAFMEKYCEQAGRPETSCDDFFVSYDAYTDYRSCAPNEFYAYYADLKQWANHEKENVVIWDKQKHEYRFGPHSLKEDKIINPIELYAYYIGMYINNMRNGIYMKYLMSFPVGYPKKTRQLIVHSFERGIRKSLPQCILDDEECMKEFSVRLGISEPAAYAVTALEMSELEPEDENEQYRYGIFDFGGGTADFGFGIWRGASEEEYEVEGYDYVLECFGADSDVTLGGEKILELLAYAVFKKNRGVARRNRITCSLPYGEQAFLGSETLISNSQIAQRNMSILKEELRPLWHQEENWEKKYRHGTEGKGSGADMEYEEYIEPMLYDIDGNKLSDCRFAVDTKGLITLIKSRIQKGVDAFFKCMGKAFQRENKLEGCDGPIYIFLAGNSSKSIFVKELFEEMIRNLSSDPEDSRFKLVEPLSGERGDEYVPNGKTSVAYGLIKSREGSSIKVEKNYETDAEEQTRFRYYLGRERRHHFDCRLSPAETDYGTWVRFQGAARPTVRIYYTTDPTADLREEPPVIDNIPYKEISVAPRKDAYIFIKACEPAVIEYTVASPDEMVEGKNEVFRIAF